MTTRENEPERIRAVVEGLSGAIREKDAARALSHYAADVVEFSLAPPLRGGRPSPEELTAWFDTWRGAIGHEVHALDVSWDGEVAFCTSLNHMTGTKTDGERVDLWFRASYGLRKLAGRWLIVHEHESVPFTMDGSYRAAIDLRPEETGRDE